MKGANSSDGATLSALVDEDNAPEEGKLPERYGKIVNLADNEGLAKKFREEAGKQITRFETQQARIEFVTKTMDVADRMWRVALNRDETNSQTKDTLSNVTSPMFHIQERAITAGEMAILFGDNKMPCEFEPEVNTTEYTRQDGVLISEQQNMLEEYTFSEDRRKDKIDEILHFTNKYGVQCIGLEWVRETRMVTENVPDAKRGKLKNGQWRKIKRETKKRVVKDWPELTRIPIEDCFFDANIRDIQDQRWFAFRSRMGVEKLYQQQIDGYICNADKLTEANLYQGETQQDSALNQRKTNAGESDSNEQTGEVEVWNVFGRVSIDPSKKGKEGEQWAPGKIVPEIYWAVFAGDIRTGAAVCLKLCKLPHWHGRIPYWLVRSNRDDKGAYSTGNAKMLESLYWQCVTNLNQAIDNVTEINWAPMVANGQVLTSDLTFKKNKLIKIGQMTKLERMNIPSTTQITMSMHDKIEGMANQLTGADKPISAQPLGGRTSATEANNIFDQAMLPLAHKASFMSEQIFTPMLEMDAECWRQYGDPRQTISITHNNLIYGVNPGDLYGPIRTKITAVTRFRNNTVRRMEINSFLQNVAPLFMNAMGEDGQRILGREAFELFGIPKGEEIFPMDGDYDARARAQAEVDALLVQGVWVAPKQEENQKTHLAVLRPALRQFELLGDTPDKNIKLAKLHIAMREQFEDQKSQRNKQAMLTQGGGGNVPQGLPGEQVANPVEAMQGAATGG